MKLFAVFLGALAAAITARKITSPDSPGFFEAVSDAASEAASTVEDVAQEIAAPVIAAFGTKYDSLITASATANGIDPKILYKLLYQESRFRDDIITGKTRSSTGAMGIAQFMPPTAVEWLGSEAAALDPNKAIPGAAKYLAWLIKRTGSVAKGVAAYNWGIGNVTNKGVLRAPTETQNYVLAITGEKLA